jgi:hypothetical protein
VVRLAWFLPETIRSGTSIWARCQWLLEQFLKLPHEPHQRNAQRLANLPQFQQVQPSRPGFVVAHESLGLPEPLGHVHLPESSLPAKPAQHGKEGLLLLPVGCEPRAALLHSARRIEGGCGIYNLCIFWVARAKTYALQGIGLFD